MRSRITSQNTLVAIVNILLKFIWELGIGNCELGIGNWELGIGNCELVNDRNLQQNPLSCGAFKPLTIQVGCPVREHDTLTWGTMKELTHPTIVFINAQQLISWRDYQT